MNGIASNSRIRAARQRVRPFAAATAKFSAA